LEVRQIGYAVHLGTSRTHVGTELAEFIFNPKVAMDDKIRLIPVTVPQVVQ
jgi:hypothetical protein